MRNLATASVESCEGGATMASFGWASTAPFDCHVQAIEPEQDVYIRMLASWSSMSVLDLKRHLAMYAYVYIYMLNLFVDFQLNVVQRMWISLQWVQ